MIAGNAITVGGVVVTVRELTVAEIRAWLMRREAVPATDVLGELLFVETTLDEIREFSDLSAEAQETLTPAQLREVWERVKASNADFFGMRARLLALRLPDTADAGETPPEGSSARPSS